MKTILNKIKSIIKNLSMQKKLFYTFSLPVVVSCIIVSVLIGYFFSGIYAVQSKNSIEQSCAQTADFIGNHVQNMHYISELVCSNRDVYDTLSNPSFGKYKNEAEAYREFYKLSSTLRELQASNDTYRISMYVPDELYYSTNNYYFYSEEELKKQNNYKMIENTLSLGKQCYAVVEDPLTSSSYKMEKNLGFFDAVEIENNNEKKIFITKVALPIGDVQEILQRTANAEQGAIAYLTDGTGNILATSNDEKTDQLLKEGAPLRKMNSWSRVTLDGTRYLVVWEDVNGLGGDFFCLISEWELLKQEWAMIFQILLLLVIVALTAVIASKVLSGYYVNRLLVLQGKMKNLEKGELNSRIVLDENVRGDEIDEIDRNFNYMAEELKHLMKEHYRLGKEVMSSELKALQAQINPHFLYNTLDLINWGAMEHQAYDVADMSKNLGQFYRLSLNHGKTAIRIDEELKHVEAYFNIESMHFPGALYLEIQVPEEIRQYACMNITLQPFVENAIMHGIAEHPELIDCTIKIDAQMEGTDIIFHVTDDGLGMPKEMINRILAVDDPWKEGGYGVKNINFRLKLCYGETYGLSYESEEGIGTTVSIRIPVMTVEELEQSIL